MKIVKLGNNTIPIKHPGLTRKECKKMGFKNGCDPRCWKKLLQRGGRWVVRVALAKALCKRVSK